MGHARAREREPARTGFKRDSETPARGASCGASCAASSEAARVGTLKRFPERTSYAVASPLALCPPALVLSLTSALSRAVRRALTLAERALSRALSRYAGPEVALRDNNTVVSGSGSVLSSAVLMQDKVHFEVEVLRPGPPSVANPRPQSLCARLRPFAHALAMLCAALRQAPSASACAGPTSTPHGRWTFRPTAGRWWPPRGRSPLATRKRSRSTSPSSSPCPTSSYVVVVDVRRAKLPTHGMGWPLTRRPGPCLVPCALSPVHPGMCV